MYKLNKIDPPPLPLTNPPNQFGSGMSRGTSTKFTTFHQHHHQLGAHPQYAPPTPTNGSNGNGSSIFQTQTIQIFNQQHFVVPSQLVQHSNQQQQQYYDTLHQSSASSSYVSNNNNNTHSRMSVPLGITHFSPQKQQMQSSSHRGQFWNQQKQYTIKNDCSGNTNKGNIESG